MSGSQKNLTDRYFCAFERDPIPYALETDWPVGAAGFEPLHIRIGICQDSQPGGAGLEFAHLELKARPIDA